MSEKASSHITFRLGQPLPPMPAPSPAPERAVRPPEAKAEVERFWLLFASNVRKHDHQIRCLELGLDRARKKPRLYWRRFAISNDAEMRAAAVTLEALGLSVSFKLKSAERQPRRPRKQITARPRSDFGRRR